MCRMAEYLPAGDGEGENTSPVNQRDHCMECRWGSTTSRPAASSACMR
jgi:hypothetical protein